MEQFGTKWNWMEHFSVKKNFPCELAAKGPVLWYRNATNATKLFFSGGFIL